MDAIVPLAMFLHQEGNALVCWSDNVFAVSTEGQENLRPLYCVTMLKSYKLTVEY